MTVSRDLQPPVTDVTPGQPEASNGAGQHKPSVTHVTPLAPPDGATVAREAAQRHEAKVIRAERHDRDQGKITKQQTMHTGKLVQEQKSYLRGKRYNLEKTGRHAPSALTFQEQDTSKRLADDYKVSQSSIQADGRFATAVDTLEAQVRQDISDTVLRRHRLASGRANAPKPA